MGSPHRADPCGRPAQIPLTQRTATYILRDAKADMFPRPRQPNSNLFGGVMAKIPIRVTVNGQSHEAEVEPRTLLVHFLREDLGLTGTKIGCDTSQCGACVVMMNGSTVKSCTCLAVQADGADIGTIEGLAEQGNLHPIQEAFWDNHGLQCGYCTAGMIMTAVELLERNPHPTADQVRAGLEGNLCRCTGYQNIVKSVLAAAEQMGG